MGQKKRVLLVSLSLICGCLLLGGLIYNSLFVDLYGFHLRKSTIRNVVVYANQHAYYVKNPDLVNAIYSETAHLERAHKIDPAHFPQYNVYPPLPHFLIQTNTNASYGGNIWRQGTLMDSNGYYWKVTPRLLQLLESATTDPGTQKVY